MNKLRRPLSLRAFLALALLGAGCHSTPSTDRVDVDSLAFVEIHGHESIEVARAVSDVFKEAGYAPIPLPPNKAMNLAFEKEGSMTSSVVYGDWSSKVWYRVKIKIETPDPQVHLVKCDAYRIVGHGDVRFEEEKKIAFKKGPYQELLEKVKARLP
jgi:hypothetical protein